MGLVLVVHNPTSTWTVGPDPVEYDGERGPAPAILAQGIAHGRIEHHYLYDDGRPVVNLADAPGKTPYVRPSMDEIRAVPWNGLNVVSTFSGCGGSSTGWRTAGYRVLYAVEFIPAAQDSYAANKADYTYLDRRDVREVTAEQILEQTGLEPGELDVLEGSPPCEAFSSAGKRDATWGKEVAYSGKRQRMDDLFFEYSRLLDGLKPRAFVAENVAGLARGKAKGYFQKIIQALRACGYRVGARILDAQWLGVPQTRQRLIFVGLRDDVAPGLEPPFPAPWPFQYTIRDALPDIFTLGEHRRVLAGSFEDFHQKRDVTDEPSPAILTAQPNHYLVEGDGSDATRRDDGTAERRRLSIPEVKALSGFPPDYELTGTYGQRWERLGDCVPPPMMRAIAQTLEPVLK